MQKLKWAPTRTPAQQGSAFVSVVALSLVMCLAALGFLQLASSLSNNEKLALEEAKAFYAAEGGLLAATNYARRLTTTEFNGQNHAPLTITATSHGTSNGYHVACTLNTVTQNSRLNISCTTVESIAGGSGRVRVAWDAVAGSSQYAFLYGSENPVNGSNSWVQTPGDPDDWDGPGSDPASPTYVGRFHQNEGIKLCGPDYRTAFKGGLVTTSNQSVGDGWFTRDASPSSDTLVPNAAGYLNNFDHGVQFGHAYNSTNHPSFFFKNTNQYHRLLRDSVFLDRFISGVPAVALNNNTTASVLASSPTVTNLTAPAGIAVGEGEWDYRPTLVFNNASATYFFFNNGAYANQQIPNYNGRTLRATTHLNVLGVTQGKVTVVTTAGNSIAVVADGNNNTAGRGSRPYEGLVYNDFSRDGSGNPAQDTASNNVLSLVSGRNILFLPSWNDRRTGNPGTLTRIRNVLRTTGRDSLFLFVNAALVAVDDANSAALWFNLDTAGYRYYRLFTYGTITSRTDRMQCWSGANGGGQAPGAIYCTDMRLGNTHFMYPGQQIVRDANGLTTFNYVSWKRTVL